MWGHVYMNNISKVDEFYLDVARYTFNYLSESDKNSLVVKLCNMNEKRKLDFLIRKVFQFAESEPTSSVLIYADKTGLCARYVESDEGESYDDFVNMLYMFADREDSTLTHLTTKRLFTENLRNGSKRLNNIR